MSIELLLLFSLSIAIFQSMSIIANICEFLLCIRHSSYYFIYIYIFNPYKNSKRKNDDHSHFIDDKTEAQITSKLLKVM